MNWLDELAGDTAYATRLLRKRPAFTSVAVLSLAIGIGANTALFSVVDAVVLHPVPLTEADRLVSIDEFKDGKPSNGNPPRTYDWGAFTPAFESVTGYYGEDLVLTGQGDPVRLSALRTCGDPLRTLRIQPALGRGFTAAEQRGQGGPVALVSDEAWRQRFGSDTAILGRALMLSGKSYTIIGVLPSGVSYPADADVWLPIPPESQDQAARRAAFLNTVARLKPGVKREDVQPQLRVVATQLAQQYPATDKTRTARAVSLNEFETRESRAPLLILWATALLVLLLACVNFASLLLSRSFTRQREASIRMALGAGRMRLIRLYLSESVLIALLGGAIGLAGASLTVSFLVSLLPATLPNLTSVNLNPRVIGLAVAMSLLSGVLAGWVPAWRIAGSVSGEGLRVREGLSTNRSQWVQKSLLACEVALSVIVLTGAVLLTRSLMKIAPEPLGFRPENVMTVNIDMPWDTPQPKLVSFYRQAIDGFSTIPGVRTVGMIDRLPLKGGSQGRVIYIRNQLATEGGATEEISLRATAGNYFAAAGIPLLAGRTLDDHQVPGVHEVMVNQAFAARYLPAGSAIGEQVRIDDDNDKRGTPLWCGVVGVVGDVRQEASKPPPPEVYVAAKDTYWPMQVYVIRANGDPRQFAEGIRQTIRQIDSTQVVGRIARMEETVDGAHAQPRLRAQLFSSFALVALLLTALGIYSLQAQAVAQRTKEIGVRIALGSAPAEASALILRQNLLVVCLGLALGILGAAWLTGFLKSVLYGISALDPAAFAAGVLGLLVTTAVASYLPARRASSVDPMIALRHD